MNLECSDQVPCPSLVQSIIALYNNFTDRCCTTVETSMDEGQIGLCLDRMTAGYILRPIHPLFLPMITTQWELTENIFMEK